MTTDLLFALAWAGLATGFCLWFVNEIGQAFEQVSSSQFASTDNRVAEVAIGLPAEVFLMIRLGLAAALFIVGLLAVNAVAGAMLAVFGFAIPKMVIKRYREKRVKLAETQLIEGLELLGNSLKSGLTLPQAIEILVKEFPPPISKEFAQLLAETRLGVDLNDGLRNMAERLGSTIFHILATGIAVTKRCGGDLTVIFANIAQTIREQSVIEGKLDAVTAQGRFQGLILSIMPFALMVILWFVDRKHVETLFGYKIGIWAVCVVISFVVLAQAWIGKLLKIDV